MRSVVNTSNALAFIQLAAAGAGVGVVGSVASLVAVAHLTAYSRDQEREADTYGHEYLMKHGYDPREGGRIWDQLMAERDADETEEPQSIFLSSHPLPDERSAALAAMAEQADPSEKQTDLGKDRFDAVFLPHRASFLRDEFHLRRYDRFEKLLDLIAKGGRKLGELKFFRGEMYRLRDKPGDMETAQELYNSALKASGAPVETYRSMGQVHQKLGNPGKAKVAFNKYLSLKPTAKDAKMIRYMLRTKK